MRPQFQCLICDVTHESAEAAHRCCDCGCPPTISDNCCPFNYYVENVREAKLTAAYDEQRLQESRNQLHAKREALRSFKTEYYPERL